jgi:hypothetical protein
MRTREQFYARMHGRADASPRDQAQQPKLKQHRSRLHGPRMWSNVDDQSVGSLEKRRQIKHLGRAASLVGNPSSPASRSKPSSINSLDASCEWANDDVPLDALNRASLIFSTPNCGCNTSRGRPDSVPERSTESNCKQIRRVPSENAGRNASSPKTFRFGGTRHRGTSIHQFAMNETRCR